MLNILIIKILLKLQMYNKYIENKSKEFEKGQLEKK